MAFLLKGLLFFTPVRIQALVVVLASGMILTSMGLLYSRATADGEPPVAEEEVVVEAKTFALERDEDFSQFLLSGKILSHETANIFARRNGLVKDILKDIGDSVEEGEVIALLLPPGVEGENEAVISEQRARVSQAYSDMVAAQQVAHEVVQQEQRQLEEMRVRLQEAEQERLAELNKAQSSVKTTQKNERSKVKAARQKIELTIAEIDQLEDQIQESYQLRDARIRASEENVDQFLEQGQVAISHARLTVEHALLGDQGRLDQDYVLSRDVSSHIGYWSSQDLQLLVSDYNKINDAEDAFLALSPEEKKVQVWGLFDQTVRLLEDALSVLKMSNPTVQDGHQQLADTMDSVNTALGTLFQAKDRWEDAVNGHDVTVQSEGERIVGLERKLDTLKEGLDLAKEELEVALSSQDKAVELAHRDFERTEVMEDADLERLRAQIAVSEQKVKSIQAQQNQRVASERGRLGVASAQLQKQLATQGHQEIRSPFSGVISKRFIGVGEMVSSQLPAFELVNVSTTLAEKAKREIQFDLPEELVGTIQEGDQLDFFLLNEEVETYQAEVTRMSPQVDQETHTITVQAKIPDELELPHNLTVRVRLARTDEPVYRVPFSSLQRENDRNYLWVVGEEKPTRQEVTVVAEDGEYAHVSGELDESLEILRDPPTLSESLSTDDDD